MTEERDELSAADLEIERIDRGDGSEALGELLEQDPHQPFTPPA